MGANIASWNLCIQMGWMIDDFFACSFSDDSVYLSFVLGGLYVAFLLLGKTPLSFSKVHDCFDVK